MFQIGHKTNVGRKHSREWTEKVRAKTKGRKVTLEFRDRMKQVNIGKKLKPETIRKMIELRTGKHHSENTKRKISETRLKNTGGITIDKGGYRLIFKREHPFAGNSGYVREHRLIMESILGRYLLPNEYVHHKDGNRGNNEPGNLELYEGQKEHRQHHISISKEGVKLSHENVRIIRSLHSTGKYLLKDLGKMFGVHLATISKIVHRQIFKEI